MANILLLKHILTLEGELFHSELSMAHIWYRNLQLYHVPRESEQAFTIVMKIFLPLSHILLRQTLQNFVWFCSHFPSSQDSTKQVQGDSLTVQSTMHYFDHRGASMPWK